MITTKPAATRAAGRPREHQTILELARSPLRQAGRDIRIQALVVAGLSAGAAAMHAAVIPEHAEEYWPFGVFFAAIAVLQIGCALAVVRHPSQRLYLVGAAASAALIALWVVSRTSGVPLGPEPWHAEPVALVDVLASVLEVGIVLVAANARVMHRATTTP